MFTLNQMIWLPIFPIYWIWYNDLFPLLLAGEFFSFFLNMLIPIFFIFVAVGSKYANKKLDYDEFKDKK